EVEDHHRISSISKKRKSVTAYNDSSNSRSSNVNAICAECGKCVFNSNHDACVSKYLNDVNARARNQCQNGFTKDELHQMAFAEYNTSFPASFFIIKTFEHNSLGLVPQCQMTSDHNSSKLAIQDHNDEQSSSKLVPKVVP
ncbi:hypothetical protein Tco_0497279, partial [Tanacetum coccineum]